MNLLIKTKRCFFFQACREYFGGKIFFKLFLVFSIITFSLLLSIAGRAEELEVKKNIRMVIADFDMIEGESRFDIMKRSIPELLHVALFPYEEIELISRDNLWRKLNQKFGIGKDIDPQRIYEKDILREFQTDYLLRGKFYEFNGELEFAARLIKVDSDEIARVDSISMAAKDIFKGIEAFATEIVIALNKMYMIDFKVRSFAVSCFQDKSTYESVTSAWLSKSNTWLKGKGKRTRYSSWEKDKVDWVVKRDLPILLSSLLAKRIGTKLVPSEEMEEYCDDVADGFALAKKIEEEKSVDAVIGGSVQVMKNTISIYPNIYISGHASPIEIACVEGNLENYLDLKVEAAKIVKKFLNGILTKEGNWKTDQLEIKTEAVAKSNLGEDETVLKLLKGKIIKEIENDPDHFYLDDSIKNKKQLEKRLKNIEKSERKQVLDTWRQSQALAYQKKGEQLFEKKQLDLAYYFFHNALMMKDDYSEAHYMMGLIKLEQKQYQGAVESFQKALKTKKDYVEAQKALADTYLRSEEYPKSIEAYKKVLVLNPDEFVEIYKKIAYIYFLQGKYESAKDSYKKLLDKSIQNEKKIDAYIGLGYIENMQNGAVTKNDFEEDPDLLSKLLEAKILEEKEEGNDYYYFNNRVWSETVLRDHLDKNGISEAVTTTVLNLWQKSRQAREKAIVKWYEKALEIDPKNEKVINRIAGFFRRRGEEAQSDKKHQLAADYFNKEVKYIPTPRAIFLRAYNNSRAVFQDETYNYSTSIDDYLKVIELTKGKILLNHLRRNALINLVEVYILEKMYDEAKSLAEKMVEEFEKDNIYKLIARYFIVITKILQGQDYTKELEQFRSEYSSGNHEYLITWSFKLFDKFIETNKDISPKNRKLIITITDELKQAGKKT
jgi:tetratricopeptide (TPR) repeat protein/TolB-like protein